MKLEDHFTKSEIERADKLPHKLKKIKWISAVSILCLLILSACLYYVAYVEGQKYGFSGYYNLAYVSDKMSYAIVWYVYEGREAYVARLFSLAQVPLGLALFLTFFVIFVFIEDGPIKCWKLLKQKCHENKIIIENHFSKGTIKQFDKRVKRQRYMALFSILLIPIIGYAILCFIMQLFKAMDVGSSYGIDGLINVLSVWLSWIGGVDPSSKYCGYELRLIDYISSAFTSLGGALSLTMFGIINFLYWRKNNLFPKCWALLKPKDTDKNGKEQPIT